MRAKKKKKKGKLNDSFDTNRSTGSRMEEVCWGGGVGDASKGFTFVVDEDQLQKSLSGLDIRQHGQATPAFSFESASIGADILSTPGVDPAAQTGSFNAGVNTKPTRQAAQRKNRKVPHKGFQTVPDSAQLPVFPSAPSNSVSGASSAAARAVADAVAATVEIKMKSGEVYNSRYMSPNNQAPVPSKAPGRKASFTFDPSPINTAEATVPPNAPDPTRSFAFDQHPVFSTGFTEARKTVKGLKLSATASNLPNVQSTPNFLFPDQTENQPNTDESIKETQEPQRTFFKANASVKENNSNSSNIDEPHVNTFSIPANSNFSNVDGHGHTSGTFTAGVKSRRSSSKRQTRSSQSQSWTKTNNPEETSKSHSMPSNDYRQQMPQPQPQPVPKPKTQQPQPHLQSNPHEGHSSTSTEAPEDQANVHVNRAKLCAAIEAAVAAGRSHLLAVQAAEKAKLATVTCVTTALF